MTSLLARFFGQGNELDVSELPASLRDVIEPWLRAADEGAGIAFLPRLWQGRLWWYGLAPDSRSRRELLALLDAWVGPTASDLASSRGRLDRSDPFDATLAAERPSSILRFEVLPRTGAGATPAKLEVRSALKRMVRLLDGRPPSEFRATRSSGEVLEDLGHAMSTGDRGLAQTLLVELRSGGDLDETNMAFVRFRVHAGLEQWQDVLKDPALPDVLGMRRPPGVTRAIQQAVYGVHLASLDAEERDGALLAAFEDVSEQYAGLTTGSPPAASRSELLVQFLFAIAADESTRAALIERLLDNADAVQIGLRSRLKRLRSAAEAEPVVPLRPPRDPMTEATARYVGGDALGALEVAVTMTGSLAAARLAVSAAADIGTPDAARVALNMLAGEEALRAAVLASGVVGRTAVAVLEGLIETGGPNGWASWFDRVATGVAQDEAVGWISDLADQWTPLPQAEVQARMWSSSDATLEVLGLVAGRFLALHAGVLDGPAKAAVAERMIAALALSGRTSAGVQVQVLSLIDTLLAAGPSGEQVEAALEWLDVIRGSMAASSSIDWQTDLLQTVAFHVIPKQAHAARQRYLYSSLDDLRRLRTALDSVALESVAAVCESLDLSLPADLEQIRAAGLLPEPELYGCLAGRRVVLYSLMESAARRAAETLRRIVPSIDVVTTADHVGSERLADMSTNADVVVIATASAKHAATEFIEQKRNGRPIIYVHSKGSSAMLRELGRFCE
ncbi:protein DpdD [Micromonospora halotolerans]|uniref:Protein DpdD n=1 Tax=Micromonospora halotolerans TaxID=709879 RepID=A0ABZ0A050_9ACTN|nr:protein DpdD [Micromonospora halotolerans]WNM40909.1 protein DpdD [Micromonospora halotolerans]